MSERVCVESLEPTTRAKCIEHQARAQKIGLHTLVTSGARSWSEQLDEYSKGRARTAEGWIVVDERQVVTRALPDRDPHVRAAAYDLWLLFPWRERTPAGAVEYRLATMDPKDGWTSPEIEQQTTLWGALIRIGTELELVAGAHWPKLKDWPHFELPNWRALPLPT